MILKNVKSNHYVRTIVLFLVAWFVLSNNVTLTGFELHRNLCYVILLALYLFVLIFQVQKKGEISDYLVLLGGFLVQFIFVTATEYTVSTHDMGVFEGFGSTEIGSGHFGYIGYLFNFGQLPDVNPISVWGYYNPPLHYVLVALWLKVNSLFGLPEAVCLENMQLLTWLYSMLCLCIVRSILKETQMSEKTRKVWLVFISFFPFFFYASGALGNDILSVLFSFMAVLYTIKWYKDNSYKNIIMLAFAIGLGMMTKLNVGLIAPATAFVFLYVLWKRRSEWKKLFAQFLVFGVICVPLGLWWSIRCYVMYDMPIGYVQPLLASPIDVSWYTASQRFFPDSSIWLNPFMNYVKNTPTYDYGIFSTMIKTGLFCDYPYYYQTQWGYQLCRLLVLLALVLLIFIIGTFIWKLYEHIRYKLWDDTIFWFASIALVVQVAMFINFVFEFPNVCSADFRYVVPLLVYFMLITKQTKELNENQVIVKVKKMIAEIAQCIAIVFAVLSATMYILFLLGLHG